MTVQSAKARVVRNPCASTAAVVTTVMGLLGYVASLVGVSLPMWVAALIAGSAISASLSFSAGGLIGIWRFLLYGRQDD